ncbi:RNA polymerase sigma factor (sigma-70 family) [Siphonobacter sp. SORGH_AS 1065]|nr:RNA polymerase sigma factor (sigma-70 family) [Siphonobacter sp. SORGH_AS_1065]
MKTEDVDIWNTFLQGNRESFELIYAQHYKALYEYGMRKLGNPEQVRDYIHDLFVKLWTNRSGTSATDNIRYFLLASLRNLILNSSTKKSNLQYVDIEEADDFKIDFNAETEFIRLEQVDAQSRQVIQALNQLSPRQKEVLYLRYFEELEFHEIAFMMSITVKGVYKLNSRAMETLRSILDLPNSSISLLLLLRIKGIL